MLLWVIHKLTSMFFHQSPEAASGAPDESTLRASNSVNIDQAQERHPRKTIAQSSVTSLASDTSNMSLDTTARLRIEDFPRFTDTDVVHKALAHLACLTTKHFDDLATQHKSGQEVVQRAQSLIGKLQGKVDKALNAAFGAGILSSGVPSPDYPGGYIPTNRSRSQVQRLSQTKRINLAMVANSRIRPALQVFDDITAEAIINTTDRSLTKTAIEHWLKHDEDEDLIEAVQTSLGKFRIG